MKQKLTQLKQKLSRGSVLAYSLIIMAIILATAIGIAAVTVREKKSAGTTAQSNQAFAVADSGSEVALQQVAKNPNSPISSLGTCKGNTVTISVANGTADITFYSNEEATVPIDCDGNLGDARKIKSVGQYADTARAVEVAVAAGECNDNQIIYLIRSSSGGSFTQADFDFLKSKIDGGSVIAAVNCLAGSNGYSEIATKGGGTIPIYDGASYVKDSKKGDKFDFAQFSCVVSQGCVVSSGSSCSGGWKVFEYCQ
jgi:uncharacterized protein (UPF0333 family)